LASDGEVLRRVRMGNPAGVPPRCVEVANRLPPGAGRSQTRRVGGGEPPYLHIFPLGFKIMFEVEPGLHLEGGEGGVAIIS
jgi:hypothetical protein